jgi:hypothetical protein
MPAITERCAIGKNINVTLMITDIATYPYALKHENGCGKYAFYMKFKPKEGDTMQPNEAIGVNGESFIINSKLVCTSCTAHLIQPDAHPKYIVRRRQRK